MGAIKEFMAKRCENCPLCNHARQHPETLFGKLMALHGKICPFWRSWEQQNAHKQDDQASSAG